MTLYHAIDETAWYLAALIFVFWFSAELRGWILFFRGNKHG